MTFQAVLKFVLLGLLLNYSVFAECPKGAIEGFNDEDTAACYLYERFPAQFVTAERLCRDSHGHLASISDLFVNAFVAQGGVEAFDVMQIDNFWIGGNDLEKRGRWEWIDGDDFSFENWDQHQPANDSRSFCVALSLSEGQWEARSCYESKPYVCELPASTHSTDVKQTHNNSKQPLRSARHQKPTVKGHSQNGVCEDGWAYLKSTDLCYKVVADASDCYRPDIQEASIHTKAENNFVGELALKEAKANKEGVKIRLSLAQYNPQKSNKQYKETNSLIPPQAWGIKEPTQRRQYFNVLHEAKKHHKKHDSTKKHEFVWFDGTPVNFQNWAKSEPKTIDEFTCAQFNVDPKSKKFEWTSIDCIKQEHAVCSQKAKSK